MVIYGTLNAEVDRFQDAPLDGKQLRRETQLAFFKTRSPQNLRHMPMFEHRISRKVLRNLNKTSLKRRFTPRPTDSRFSIANNSEFPIDNTCLKQRPKRKIRRRGIAARV